MRLIACFMFMIVSAQVEASLMHEKILESIAREEYYSCHRYPEISSIAEKNACIERIYDINNSLNKLWSLSEDKAVSIELFEELWLNPQGILILNNPLIRLNLAFLMGQASWVGVECASCSLLRNYVISKISSDDVEVLSASITALGVVGMNKDVSFLKPIILSEREGTAEKAVTTAVELLNHRESVTEFMSSLLPSIQRDSLKKNISRYIYD